MRNDVGPATYFADDLKKKVMARFIDDKKPSSVFKSSS